MVLGVSLSCLKKVCRKLGVPRWPFRSITSLKHMASVEVRQVSVWCGFVFHHLKLGPAHPAQSACPPCPGLCRMSPSTWRTSWRTPTWRVTSCRWSRASAIGNTSAATCARMAFGPSDSVLFCCWVPRVKYVIHPVLFRDITVCKTIVCDRFLVHVAVLCRCERSHRPLSATDVYMMLLCRVRNVFGCCSTLRCA